MRPLVFALFIGLSAVTPAQAWQERPADQDRLVASEPVQHRVLSVSEADRNMGVLELPARLDVEDVALHEALERLHEASGVPLVYSPTLVPAKKVTCHCAGASVGEALERLLRATPGEAVPNGDQVIIALRDGPAQVELSALSTLPYPGEPALRSTSDDATALEPPREQPVGVLTGRVRDAQTGEPLPSVQVYLEGPDIGGLTQPNGRYLLQEVPAGTHTIVAERIGYGSVSREVTLEGDETLVENFELSQEALALDEMVVTGTPGEQQRRSLGNVVAEVDAGVIENSSAISMEGALGNSVSGVRMMAPSGAAGGETSIRIRGSSSLALQGDPLVYVDGIRINQRRAFDGRGSATSRLQDINPDVIESIEVIKGPAAATLYGTEASNGVIQIITKRGVEGETVFRASAQVGTNWKWSPEEMFGPHWWRDQETGEIKSHNLYEVEQAPDRLGMPFFQYGPIQRYNISARGGTDVVRYFASVNRTDEEGITRMDWTERWNVRTAVELVPSDDLTMRVNASRTTGATRDMGSAVCWFSCWANPSTVDGDLRGGLFIPYDGAMNASKDIRETNRTIWNAELRHNPTSWFSHRIVGGIDDAVLERVDFTPRGANGFAQFLGTSGREGERLVWKVETPTRTLDYSATLTLPLSERLQSSTSWGVQWFNSEDRTVFAQGRNFAVSALETVGAASERDSDETIVENTTLGTFVQNQFDWDNRVFVTGAIRFDDNSAFGQDFDAVVYPKISGSWVMSEEDFWPQDFLAIEQFRLRGAWGQSGQQPNAFAASRLFRPETGPGGLPVLTPEAFGNPDLGPEVGEEIELGFDATFLDGRLSAEFTWYDRVTEDAIVRRPIRPSVGFPGTQFVNIGQTNNWGTETMLSAEVLQDHPLRWNLDLSFTTMGNRIDEMGEIDELTVVALSGMPSRSQFHVEEFPIAGLFAKRVLSADFQEGNSGAVTNVMCDGGTGKRGLEQGGEPVPCTEAPRVFWGQVDPSWQINLRSSWTIFQDWRLSTTVDAMGGHHLNADYLAGMNTRHSRPFVFQEDPIFMGNLKFSRGGNVIHEAGFAKLREVSLRYSLPESLVDRIGAASASIRGSMYNVATLWTQQDVTPSGQEIWDPEMHSPNFEFNGIATGSLPPISNATLRFDVTF